MSIALDTFGHRSFSAVRQSTSIGSVTFDNTREDGSIRRLDFHIITVPFDSSRFTFPRRVLDCGRSSARRIRFSSLRGRCGMKEGKALGLSARPAINECARMYDHSFCAAWHMAGQTERVPSADIHGFIHALTGDRPSEFITLTAELHSRRGRCIASHRPVSSRNAASP